MTFRSNYTAHKPNAEGVVPYSAIEHNVWSRLYDRQTKIVEGKACQEFIKGVQLIGLESQQIPQLPEVNKRLAKCTSWSVVPVEALISAEEFFDLLVHRCFPAATFIRSVEELDYVTEPDIFHELFGHCPMFADKRFADFVQFYAQRVLEMDKKYWPLMQRLFWFTVEFGLIQTKQGIQIYGGGILSSYSETPYSIESAVPERRPFDLLDIFRTPYRIDQPQPIYYVIQSYDDLYASIEGSLEEVIEKAFELGEFSPKFSLEDLPGGVAHIHCC